MQDKNKIRDVFIIVAINIFWLLQFKKIVPFFRTFKEGTITILNYNEIWDSIKEVPFSAMTKEEIIGGIIVQLLFLIFVFFILKKTKNEYKISPDIGGTARAGSGECGSGRYMKKKEMNKFLSFADIGENNQISKHKINLGFEETTHFKGGVVIGSEKKKRKKEDRFFFDAMATHVFGIGSTRSGKSRRIIMNSVNILSLAGESIVATDPKGELFNMNKVDLENKGYEIIKINLRDANDSNQWNPLENIRVKWTEGDYDEAVRMANSIAEIIAPPSSGDPIWRNGEISILKASILFVVKMAKKEEVHLASVFNLLSLYGKPIETEKGIQPPRLMVELENLDKTDDENRIIINSFGVALTAPMHMRASFIASALTDLQVFADLGISKLTCESDHDLNKIGNVKTAVFIIIPDEDKARYKLATMYISETYKALSDEAYKNGGKLPVRVNYILDEFGNLPRIPNFETLMTVSAGKNIRFNIFVQSTTQVSALYGKDNMSTITGNCMVWIYLITKDLPTAELLSKMMGDYTTKTTSSKIGEKSGVEEDSGKSLIRRAMLLPEEILKFPEDKGLVFVGRQSPIITNVKDFSEMYYSKSIETREEGVWNDIKNQQVYMYYLDQHIDIEDDLSTMINQYLEENEDDEENENRIIDFGKFEINDEDEDEEEY